MNKSVHPVVFALLLSMMISGCSVQKNTWTSRTFHNMTAKYNVLFNGQESYNKGVAQIENGYLDDYSEILPVFPFQEKSAADLASADMDRTIKKCTKLISLHSITAKPKVKNNKNLTEKQRAFFSKKEYNLFVDDAYLLMGKAHFCKQEYEQAGEIFRLLMNDFKNQPVAFEAQVWYSRLQIQNQQSRDAFDILTSLENNPRYPAKLLPDLHATLADYYFNQKDYIQAITYLEKALGGERHKRTRTRYMYILAQSYEKTGNLKRASDYYVQVIKMNPPYDMAFHARINRALAYEQGFGRAEDIEDELNKMLRDDKNIDYLDQIYFALGNLANKEGRDDQAMEYYQKSINANTGNDQQKARSYLTIASYFYAKPDYPNAKAYYDSTLTYIDPDYPGYEAVYSKSKNLTRLVTEMNTVIIGDSLIMLARLPKQELDARIDALIEQERKNEEIARMKLQEEQLDQQFGTEVAMKSYVRQQTTGNEGARWYFYNDAAKSLGYREFKLKWGNRKLEDHWQRATKSVVAFAAGSPEDLEAESPETAATQPELSKMSREYYLINIPSSDSAIDARYKAIELALYNMGLIYRNDLKDYDRASESFKSLIRRFPNSPYLMTSYYNLYGIAKDQQNQALVDYYKNLLVTQFPQSMYAKVLSNPEYFRELEAEELAVQQYYEQTYELYRAGNYAEVIIRVDQAMKDYADNPLIPQFAYLGAISRGKSSDQKVFRENLTALVLKYPGTDVAGDAQQLINYMDKEHPEMKEAEEVQISRKIYQVSPEEPHLFAFVLDKKINTNQLIFNIINFNLDNFDNLSLRVDVTDLNPQQNLILVKPFRNQEEVMQYLLAIRSSESMLKDMPAVTLLPMAISEVNLNTLREDKSIDRYLKFYHENYP